MVPVRIMDLRANMFRNLVLEQHFSQDNYVQIDDISKKLDIDSPTNNKAELIAILFALQERHKHNINKKIIIYTDLQYCIDAITKWYDQWVKTDNLKNKKMYHLYNLLKLL